MRLEKQIKKERVFFSEEKAEARPARSKRLLFLRCSQDRGHETDLAAAPELKVFLLLFLQKKKIFLLLSD
jgi:hypothetical protein